MNDPLPQPPAEVDLLAALRPRALLTIAACALIGGLLGLGAGTTLLHHAEARAVMRVGTVGMLGPVVPLSEVQARAEALAARIDDLKKAGDPQAATDARRFKVQAALDSSSDGTVVTVTVGGPDAARALALCQARLDSLMAFTHDAFLSAQKETTARLAQAEQAQTTLQKTGAVDGHAAAAFERWASELSAARAQAHRAVLFTRDSAVIDPPYRVNSNARVILLAALGCFAGMLLGLAWATRITAP